jgi:predicted nucleotidyltransferase
MGVASAFCTCHSAAPAAALGRANRNVFLKVEATQFGVYPTHIGYDMQQNLSISNALFSKVQQRVLALIFGSPERSFYTSEIVRTVNSGTGAVERELSRLQRSGLVDVEHIGNQKHYRANPNSPVFGELQSIVFKTIAIKEQLRKSLERYAERIKIAFVFGSVASQTDRADSDIDVLIVGDELNYTDLYTALQGAESVLSRKVNPIFLTSRQWRRKASEKGSFLGKVNAAPKLFVFGSEEMLRA